MKRLFPVLVATGLVVLLPAHVVAQDKDGWSLSVTPRFGYSVPDKALGVLAPGGPLVEMPPAATAGVSLDLGTPLHWATVRFSALSTFAEGLNRLISAGSSSCGDGCTALEYSSHPLKDGGSTLNLSVDLLARPPISIGRVGPYVVGGLGLKRYDLGRGAYEPDIRYRYGGRSAGFTVNLGGGVEVPVGMAAFTLEAVDYISGLTGRQVHGYSPLSERAFNTLRHDVVFSIGLKVKIFGQ